MIVNLPYQMILIILEYFNFAAYCIFFCLSVFDFLFNSFVTVFSHWWFSSGGLRFSSILEMSGLLET
jgi:hypothetical protein